MSETATGLYLLFCCKRGSHLPASEALIAQGDPGVSAHQFKKKPLNSLLFHD